MEYFRKIVTYNDGVNGNIGNYLANFGFVGENGTSLAGKDFISTREIAKQTQIYWKNDDAKQSCIRNINAGESAPTYRPYRYFSSIGKWYGNNSWVDSLSDIHGHSSFISPSSINVGESATVFSQLSLISLPNGGFIWNNVYRGTSSAPTNLVLVNNNYPNHAGGSNSAGLAQLNDFGMCSLIGIPPALQSSDVQSKYIYISACYPREKYWWSGNLRMLWDFLDDVVIANVSDNTTNFTTTEPGYENLLFDIEHASYTNLNKNVCVLIKMPRDKGYLENVYLMSTAPSNFKSGGVFSFAGRTFINLYSNVVIELPND